MINYYLLLIISAVMFAVTFFLCVIKRQRRRVEVIEQLPPDGLNPAEMGYIIDNVINSRDLTSLLYYWASHGHLKIEVTGKRSFVLYKGSKLDGDHKKYERIIYDFIWTLGGEDTQPRKRRFIKLRMFEDYRDKGNLNRPDSYTRVYSSQLIGNMDAIFIRASGMLKSTFDSTGHSLNIKWRTVASEILAIIISLVAIFLPVPLILINSSNRSLIAYCVCLVGLVVTIMLLRYFYRHLTVDDYYSMATKSSQSKPSFSVRNSGDSTIGTLAAFLTGSLVVEASENFITFIFVMLYIFGAGLGISIYLAKSLVVLAPLLAIIFLLIAPLFRKIADFRGSSAGKAKRFFTRLAAWGGGLAAAAGYIYSLMELRIPAWTLAIFVLTTLVCLRLAPNIRARTEYGAYIHARCSGFRNFLVTADKSRLEMLLEDNPNYYYDILPYAHALNVSGIWLEKCSSLMSASPKLFYGSETKAAKINAPLIMLVTGLNYDIRDTIPVQSDETPGNRSDAFFHEHDA